MQFQGQLPGGVAQHEPPHPASARRGDDQEVDAVSVDFAVQGLDEMPEAFMEPNRRARRGRTAEEVAVGRFANDDVGGQGHQAGIRQFMRRRGQYLQAFG